MKQRPTLCRRMSRASGRSVSTTRAPSMASVMPTVGVCFCLGGRGGGGAEAMDGFVLLCKTLIGLFDPDSTHTHTHTALHSTARTKARAAAELQHALALEAAQGELAAVLEEVVHRHGRVPLRRDCVCVGRQAGRLACCG